ncbi:MAG: extracellular solute-binding protein [Eubacteriales bacterium]|nr:extracellular solute-binding protein [Eubacteriales bacterium]MDD4462608.1 extracellular solute-binding protein [Eubacteriales bacterium]
MKYVRSILLLALAFVLLLGTVACGTTDVTSGSGTTTTPASGETTTKGEDEPTETTEPGETAYETKITISQTVLDAEKTGNTARDQWFNEKFNVEWEFIPVTWGDWTEKVRAMIAGDDMPDLLWWDMKLNHTAEFRGWAEAGAFREIPADLSTWPNLAAKREALTSDDEMLTVDNKLYGWPAHRNNPDWMQNVYYPLFAYRRDWAKEVGMYKEGDAYTWDEIKEMIDTVKAEDPGGNGAGNTFGITSEAWAFPGVFMEILGYAEERTGYIKTDEGWIPHFTTDAFREELKFVSELYRDGYIWKDQMVVGGSEGADNFFAGRSFMFLGNNSPSWFGGTAFPQMVDGGIVASTDDVAPMMALSPMDDKRFTLTQTEDYWTVTHFAYHVDDEKMERILDMWDWLASEDGRAFSLAGIPDVDYTRNADGTITILWEKNADGDFISPYQDTGGNMYTPPTLISSPNETSRMAGFDAFDLIHEFMQTSSDYHVNEVNWPLAVFGGEQYSTYGAFSSEVTNKIKEIMAASEDVDTLLDAYLAEMEPKWRPVADELNAQLP